MQIKTFTLKIVLVILSLSLIIFTGVTNAFADHKVATWTGAGQLIREKHIRATKIGKWMIKPEDLQAFNKSRRNR